MVFVLKSRACITLVKRAKIWFWCHPAGSIVRLAMRLLCLPRENTLWNKGGLAEMVVDKDILLIYAITHFHNFEQSQIAIGTNQLNTAKSKLLVVCQSLFFFLNTNQPRHPKSCCTWEELNACCWWNLKLLKPSVLAIVKLFPCCWWTAVQVQADVEFSESSLFYRAHLVPVFSFGENELFKQVANPKGSWLRTVQEKLQKIMGFALPLFHARGIFQYSFGLIPYRQPIHTVGKFPAPFLINLQMFRNSSVCC